MKKKNNRHDGDDTAVTEDGVVPKTREQEWWILASVTSSLRLCLLRCVTSWCGGVCKQGEMMAITVIDGPHTDASTQESVGFSNLWFQNTRAKQEHMAHVERIARGTLGVQAAIIIWLQVLWEHSITEYTLTYVLIGAGPRYSAVCGRAANGIPLTNTVPSIPSPYFSAREVNPTSTPVQNVQ